MALPTSKRELEGHSAGVNAGTELAAHVKGATPGKQLAGHTAINIGGIAPVDEHEAPVTPAHWATSVPGID